MGNLITERLIAYNIVNLNDSTGNYTCMIVLILMTTGNYTYTYRAPKGTTFFVPFEDTLPYANMARPTHDPNWQTELDSLVSYFR